MNKSIIHIPINSFSLEGALTLPKSAKGMILFVHGSGSSRHSPRNNFVADILNKAHFATLLIDLLSEEEDTVYETRFDIPFLTKRVISVIDWLKQNKSTKDLSLGLFGASTGAAAALSAAALHPNQVKAVVSRGGRPDLAERALTKVQAPTLLIVGGEDWQVIELNQKAYRLLQGEKHLEIIPKATHLFEEPGCLELVATVAQEWFSTHLT